MKLTTYKALACGLALSVLAGTTSCSEDQTTGPENGATADKSVKFIASLGAIARATETAFEYGDSIGVYAVTAADGQTISLQPSRTFAHNVPYVSDGSMFVGALADGDGIIKEEGASLAYFAVYPYQKQCDTIAGAEFDFTVNTDQSTHAGYTRSDLCTASTGLQIDPTVNLKFDHRLTNLVLNVSGFNIGGQMNIRLTNIATTAHVNINANTYAASESSATGTIITNNEATNTYKAIVPPQVIESGTEFIEVDLNGRIFNIKAPQRLELRSGREYSLNVSIVNGSIIISTGNILPWDSQTVRDEYSEKYFEVENAGFVDEPFVEGTDDSDPFDISANDRALAGGMNFITIKCKELYELFELSVKGQIGYWTVAPEVETTPEHNSYTIPIIYGTGFSEDMNMTVCGRREDGTKTKGYDVNFTYVESQSGDLNINLTFSTPKDVDLHLYTPSGIHIYYGNRGGSTVIDGESINYGLDHDSNPGCNIDGLNNENIFIPAELIEDGEYTVEVNLYANCTSDYDCAWSVVARYKDEIIPNKLASYSNPASGTYARSASSGDHTQIMKFDLHPSTQRNARSRRSLSDIDFTPRKVTDAEQWKIDIQNAIR